MVFITRDISDTEPFAVTLRNAGVAFQGRSLIKVTPVTLQESALPDTDWVFFYSRNGVRIFFDQISSSWWADKKMGAIGSSTAAAIAAYTGRPVDFTGVGADIAGPFTEVAAQQRVLFVRASDSVQSVQRQLGPEVTALDLVAYNNVAIHDFTVEPLPKILVFTSPLNVRAWYGEYPPMPWQQVVAIGQTTALALKLNGVTNVSVAENPTEQSLAEIVLGLRPS